MRKNLLKEKLNAGKTVIGTWCEIASPTVANVLANSGLDYVIIDQEHGTMSFETAELMCRAVEAEGCSPIIRTTEDSAPTLLRALEIGGQSILVPHVESVKTAKGVVEACRYSPEGQRGLGPYTRNHNYSHVGLTQSLKDCNRETLVGILVEGKEGLQNLDQIAEIPGIDLIYLGIYDISSAVGHPGELRHPEVLSAIKRSTEILSKKGVAAGSYAADLEYAKLLKDSGFRFIAYYNDAAVLREHFAGAKARIEG